MNFIKAVPVPNKPIGDYYYNKLQLIVAYPHNFVVGQTVAVNGAVYKGNLKITLIYNNSTSKISALYFGDILFKGNDTGTVLAVNVGVSSSINVNPGAITANVSTPSTAIPVKRFAMIIQPRPTIVNGKQFNPPSVSSGIANNATLYAIGTDLGGATVIGYENIPVGVIIPTKAIVLNPTKVVPPVTTKVTPPATPPVIVAVNPNPGSTPTPTGNPANNDMIPITTIIPNPGATQPIIPGLLIAPVPEIVEPSLLKNPLVQVVLAALGILLLIKLLKK